MTRSMFGWSLPPGAAGDPYAPWNQNDDTCAMCGKDVDACTCPECPVCNDVGNPRCYETHSQVGPLKPHVPTLTADQAAWAAECEAANAAESAALYYDHEEES